VARKVAALMLQGRGRKSNAAGSCNTFQGRKPADHHFRRYSDSSVAGVELEISEIEPAALAAASADSQRQAQADLTGERELISCHLAAIFKPKCGSSICMSSVDRSSHSIAYHGGEPTHRTPALIGKHPQAAGVLAWFPALRCGVSGRTIFSPPGTPSCSRRG
jgi:hypothetical protein